MKGTIFGIPLAIILLVVFIAALVDVPMYLMHQATMKQLEIPVMLRNSALAPTLTPVPTPTVGIVSPIPTTKGIIKVLPSTPSAVQK